MHRLRRLLSRETGLKYGLLKLKTYIKLQRLSTRRVNIWYYVSIFITVRFRRTDMESCQVLITSGISCYMEDEMKRRLVPFASMALMSLLIACGSDKTPVMTTAETLSELSETVRKETESPKSYEPAEIRGESALKEALRQRLKALTGISGTSGAPLKTIHQAVHFIQLANDGDYSLNIVSPVVLDFYESLSDEEKAGFLDAWENLDRYAEAILGDFSSVSSILEDAGDLDSAKELVNSATVKEKWERMRKGIAAVLPDRIAETEESETEEENKSEARAETAESIFETDKYGYRILGTDENGTTIYATDRKGNLIGGNSDERVIVDAYGRVIRLPKENEKESETETVETETEGIPSPGILMSPETVADPAADIKTGPEAETGAVPEIAPGYPTGGPIVYSAPY